MMWKEIIPSKAMPATITQNGVEPLYCALVGLLLTTRLYTPFRPISLSLLHNIFALLQHVLLNTPKLTRGDGCVEEQYSKIVVITSSFKLANYPHPSGPC